MAKIRVKRKIPMVSVLLVTYNHEQFITQVIEGVLMQKTDFEIELVIGDDGSTDRTREICEEFQSQNPDIIRLLPDLPNMGLKLNFIRTFRACRGKYIAYLEGDDWWITTDKLQKQVDCLEANPDVVFVHTNCCLYDADEESYTHRLISYSGYCAREYGNGVKGVVAEFEGRFRPIKTSTACYRRQTMNDILADDEYMFTNVEFPTQDFQLFQEMAMRGRFVFIDEETTVIAKHESISVSKNDKKSTEFRYGVYKIGLYMMDKYQIPREARQIWFRKELYFFMNDALRRKDTAIAIDALKQARKKGYITPLTQWLKYLIICVLPKKSNTDDLEN